MSRSVATQTVWQHLGVKDSSIMTDECGMTSNDRRKSADAFNQLAKQCMKAKERVVDLEKRLKDAYKLCEHYQSRFQNTQKDVKQPSTPKVTKKRKK